MVDFYLVRHGQSLGNIDFSAHKKIGDPLLPLTALGVVQAGNTANYLRDELSKKQKEKSRERKILLVHSPYERAWHTADFIDTALSDFDLVRDQHVALREQNYGIWDGLEQGDYKAVSPHVYQLWQQLKLQGLKFYCPLPEGESPADVWGRVKGEFLPSVLRTIDQYNITDVIVVSHGMTTRAVIAALIKTNEPLHQFYERLENPPNASVHFVSEDPNYKRGATRYHGSRYKHEGIIYDPNVHLDYISKHFSAAELREPQKRFSKTFELI